MKQILQSLKTGETFIEDIPCPKGNSGKLLIETTKSLVSSGTERMLVEFGKASLLGKIKQQPDKVKKVFDKIKTDGLSVTLEAVKSKLDSPIPLGYCNVGRVLEVGAGVSEYEVGQRIVSNGNHAEIVSVPKNLCAKIPENVSDEEAAFTVVGAIALQGIRLSNPTLGEYYVVIGLGIIGLIAVQLLRANGCHVLAIDFDDNKLELARQFGAHTINLSRGEDPIAYAKYFSQGHGVDSVIITAATKSNEPLHQAATMCRKRGRIVLVGVIGNEFSRADFYEKELSFQVSCSYGPGRYDDNYEQYGQDYPLAYVRWTEQRNFEAVLEMMSRGAINVASMISHKFDINEALKAYNILESDKKALGILLSYPEIAADKYATKTVLSGSSISANTVGALSASFLGAGNYSTRVLAPAFRAAGVNLKSVVSSQGVSGKLLAKKTGFCEAVTEESSVYAHDDVDMVVIVTRHNLHARQVIDGLNHEKHVFVEKPLALSIDELKRVKEVHLQSSKSLLMVGFNRRFAPHTEIIKNLLDTDKSPKSFIMTVNAGEIPENHWTQNEKEGGGRIVGEACHFIDLLRYLSGSEIVSWQASSIKSTAKINDDKATIILNFKDGSYGTIHYLANGNKAFPKERLEIFCNGKILQLDNFRCLKGWGWRGFRKKKFRSQNKGQQACVQAFIDAIKQGKQSPIPFDELFEVSRVSIEIANYLKK